MRVGELEDEMILRDYQVLGIEYIVRELTTRGVRRVLAAPTGSGKSLIEIHAQERLGPDAWIVTPRLEIATGILSKQGADVSSQAALVRSAFANHVITPIRLLNALTRGEIPRISHLILDEGHHSLADTWQRIQLLAGMPPAVLLTATPFRGTSRSTAQFIAEWGEATWVISLREAAARKVISIPKCSILPLVDDDVIELTSSGDFDVTQIASQYQSRLRDLAEASHRWHDGELWDRATVFALPSVATARELAQELCDRGMPAIAIHAATPRLQRDAAYAALVVRGAALVQVSVLGEGVDLPIRRLVDAFPRMSPVAWLQQLGRITRPSPEPPEYIATNRNLSRHCYLLEGLVPSSAIAESDAAFGCPSRRSGHRALGLEAIGKFRPTEVPLADGNTLMFYAFVSVGDGRMREFSCLVHPAAADPVWAERTHAARADGSKDWGKWQRCVPPVGLQGFVGAPARDVSEKMLSWWTRSAPGRGLAGVPANRRMFGVLPVLFDLGITFRH
jgi:superfamily II DNA or RNA helicase